MCGDLNYTKVMTLTTLINQGGYSAFGDFTIIGVPSDIDEIVLKQVSYMGTNTGVYYPFISLSDDPVCSVSIVSAGTSSLYHSLIPNITFKLQNPTPTNIRIGMRASNGSNQFVNCTDVGLLTMTLEFRRYEKE